MKIKTIFEDISKSLAIIAESLYVIASYIANNSEKTKQYVNLDVNRRNPGDFVTASSKKGDRE